MQQPEPTIETMHISTVEQQLSRLVNRISRQETRILVEQSGAPVAAIISVNDLRRLERLDEERAERFKVIDEMREAFKDVPAEEIEREAARSLAEVRAERRAEIEVARAER